MFISPDYAFPYIILVLSLVTLAVYMSASEIQVHTFISLNVILLLILNSMLIVLKRFMIDLPQSFKNLVAKKKRLVVLFSHWLLHAYGIISISRLDKLGQDLPLLALVPGPALFYLLTARFTEPNRILSEGGNGHWCHFLCRRTDSSKCRGTAFNLMTPSGRMPKSHNHKISFLFACNEPRSNEVFSFHSSFVYRFPLNPKWFL